MSDKPVLLATVFTDYICPFCYVGDVRMDRLRADYDLKVNWCFVEIHPETPVEGMKVEALGYPDKRWQQMMDNLEKLAEEDGITFRPQDFTTNSHQSLLLAEAAKEDGTEIFYRLHRGLFEAYFTGGENIGDEAVLRKIAADAGVSAATVQRAWEDEQYEERLKKNMGAAHELDVRATPTIFFGENQRLDGALSFVAFQKAAEAGIIEQRADKVLPGNTTQH